MPITSKDRIKKLKRYRFKIVSQNGSHVKLHCESKKRTVIVQYHSKALGKELEAAILKQAGIDV